MVKKFEMWIERSFKGLSTNTLCQFLETEKFCFKEEANNAVFVDLFAVFCNTANKEQINIFERIKMLVDECTWL